MCSTKRLAAAGRPFENDGQMCGMRGFKEFFLARPAGNRAQLLLDSPELRFLPFIGILTFGKGQTTT